jgi:hypothetical protein
VPPLNRFQSETSYKRAPGDISHMNARSSPENDPWNSTSPRSLRRPEPQVMDWIKPCPFHVPCVRHCVDKSAPTVLHSSRPCFPPRLQGCTRFKPRVSTPFYPLSSFTGGRNGSVFGARPHFGNKGDHRIQTSPRRHRMVTGCNAPQRYTSTDSTSSFRYCYSFNNRLRLLLPQLRV